MNNSQDNLFDITENLINYDSWNGELSFWGFVTCKLPSGGEYQPLKWCPPQSYGWGDNSHTIGSFELKVIIAVLGSSFTNSPASNEGVHLYKIKILFGSQKQLVWAVVHYFPNLVCLTKPRRE